MEDYAAARETMVDGQVRPADVTNRHVIEAMLKVPRERFVPSSKVQVAYAETQLEVAAGRQMLQPRTFAKLVDAAELQPTDFVLDVGCATGYSTAVLAMAAKAVVGIESDEALQGRAESTLSALEIDNAAVLVAPLAEGMADQGPYDVIILQGAIAVEPTALLDQLADDGRLVAIVQDHDMSSAAYFWRKTGESVSKRLVFNATAPLLAGFEGEAAFAF